MKDERWKMWERLVDELDVPEETLDAITSIFGFSVENLLSVLFYKTGYRSFEQYDEENPSDNS